MQRLAVIPICFAALVITLSAASAQRVLKVPSQYETIQAAIDAAKDKDTVLVAPGLYKEQRIHFKGKTIVVKSTDGPSQTTIDIVAFEIWFGGNQGRDAVLEGFEIIGYIDCDASPTIRNNVIRGRCHPSPCLNPAIYVRGSPLIIGNVITGHRTISGLQPPPAAAIHCKSGAPEIVNNFITGNRTDHVAEYDDAEVQGGALHIAGAGLIAGNVIADNRIYACGAFDPPTTCRSYGAGLYLGGPCTVVNNVIAFNSATSDGYSSTVAHVSEGGGIYSDGSATITNNTVYGNQVSVKYGTSSRGGGIFGGTITNTIAWANSAHVGPDIHGAGKVSYCNVTTAFPGPGNISSDPRFLNVGGRDFHLMHASPCRNKGTNGAPSLPATDFEGDRRIAAGTVDIGADEFFPHLDYSGNATPGGRIDIRLLGGTPGGPTFWAFSGTTSVPPIPIPGLEGSLHLDPGSLVIIPIGPFPAQGVLSFPISFPSTFPALSIPTQALIGLQLSNLDVVSIK